MNASSRVIGVLALQGAFGAHGEVLKSLGVSWREVRTPSDLASVDALVIPGGESSTISQLLESSGLVQPLRERIASGMAVFGTCAGMILLAREIVDGRHDQISFGAIDITVRRNAYGRQVDSFEADLTVDSAAVAGPVHGVFIRAPRIERIGRGVEVLAVLGDEPVLVRQGPVLACSFHPELSGDPVVHGVFIEMVDAADGVPAGKDA